MQTKETPASQTQAENEMVAVVGLGGIAFGNAVLMIVWFNAYHTGLWSQAAMLGFWLALGKGTIWRRLLWIMIGFFVLGPFLLGPFQPTRFVSAVLFTIAFAALFAGVGVVMIGQNARWTKLRVQFRFWELIVGTAVLGVAFMIVKHAGDFDGLAPSHWKSIYYILLRASLIGLGTAAIGMILMAQRGLPYLVVGAVAAVMTITIPYVDYLVCDWLDIDLFSAGSRVVSYLSNFVVVWMTVLLYQNAVNAGDAMIFETNDKASAREQQQS